MIIGLDPDRPADLEVADKLKEALGDFFAGKLMGDAAWARSVLGISESMGS
jgi:transcription initiation factor TFIID subunit 6